MQEEEVEIDRVPQHKIPLQAAKEEEAETPIEKLTQVVQEKDWIHLEKEPNGQFWQGLENLARISVGKGGVGWDVGYATHCHSDLPGGGAIPIVESAVWISAGYLPIYLPTYLSIYLPIVLSFYLSISLSLYRSIYLHVYLHVYLFYRSIGRSIYLSLSLALYLSVCLSIFRSIDPLRADGTAWLLQLDGKDVLGRHVMISRCSVLSKRPEAGKTPLTHSKSSTLWTCWARSFARRVSSWFSRPHRPCRSLVAVPPRSTFLGTCCSHVYLCLPLVSWHQEAEEGAGPEEAKMVS